MDMWLDAVQKGQGQFLVKPRGWLAAQVVVARVGKDTGCGAPGILESLKESLQGGQGDLLVCTWEV